MAIGDRWFGENVMKRKKKVVKKKPKNKHNKQKLLF